MLVMGGKGKALASANLLRKIAMFPAGYEYVGNGRSWT
jgi:hypothetical protein